MKTVLTTSPDVAAGFIRSGGIAAFPTETVYGLGANVFDEAAIAMIFEAKMRPADNPLIAHISDLGELNQLASEVPEVATKLIAAFFPGPLTIVLERSPRVPSIATAGLETIGIRMPGNELAKQFLTACGTPVVAPSANLSGRPSPTTWQAVQEDLDERIDCILQGDPTQLGLESTVVDCTSFPPTVLRSGAITISQLRSICPETEIYDLAGGEAPRSPGMKHRHYSPNAKVVLVEPGFAADVTEPSARIGLTSEPTGFEYSITCASVEEYARLVFEFFRACDRRGIRTIFCDAVPDEGIGAALMDRLRRAAAG